MTSLLTACDHPVGETLSNAAIKCYFLFFKCLCVVCDYYVKWNVCSRVFKMEEYSGEFDNPDTIEGADNDSNVVFGEYSDAVN